MQSQAIISISCSAYCLQCIIRLAYGVRWLAAHRMDTTVCPPTIPVPLPPQFSYNGSPRAVAMFNSGRCEVRHTLTLHTDNHALESGLSTGTAQCHAQLSQAPLDPFNTFRVTLPTHAEPPQNRISILRRFSMRRKCYSSYTKRVERVERCLGTLYMCCSRR